MFIDDFASAYALLNKPIFNSTKLAIIETIANKFSPDQENALSFFNELLEKIEQIKENTEDSSEQEDSEQVDCGAAIHSIALKIAVFDPAQALKILNNDLHPHTLICYCLVIHNFQMAEEICSQFLDASQKLSTQIMIAEKYVATGQLDKANALLQPLETEKLFLEISNQFNDFHAIHDLFDLADVFASCNPNRSKEIIQFLLSYLDQNEKERQNQHLCDLFDLYATIDPWECYETLTKITWMDAAQKADCLFSAAGQII